MQIEVKIDIVDNRAALDRIAGDTWDDKCDSIEGWLSDEFGVYVNAMFTATNLVIELGQGSVRDFVEGLESFGFR